MWANRYAQNRKMPHIHLETTSDLEENAKLPDILEALTLELCKHETIASKAVKAYHTLRSVWVMGEGAPAGFAHCEVAVLEGRPQDLKQQIAAAMMKVMQEQFSESISSGAVSVTLELREMEKDTYQK
jgi:5-carboxymethyl-2-hydroxymuconate isomerase